tara:strand:- start:4099 stop:6396 length:2298 start_codon:yes stop_codon:yes gene_type:complete
MNFLNRLLGFPVDEFNAFDIQFGFSQVKWISVGAFFTVCTLWFFWTSISRIQSLWWKLAFFALRITAFVFLFLVLLQPEMELKKIELMKNSVAVVVDDSKSMSLKTFPQEKLRKDLVFKALKGNELFLRNLGETFRLDFYFASNRLKLSSLDDLLSQYETREQNTDLNQVFSELGERYQGKSLRGILLFTDGADLAEDLEEVSVEMMKTLSSLKAPIYAYQAGTNKNFKDIGIENISGSDFGFVFQPIRLTAAINASAIGEKSIPVVVKQGDKVILSKTLSIVQDRRRYKVDLELTPLAEGKKVYTVSVPVFADESNEINNRREFQVKVVRDRIRVLHLNGRPSWDSRFLREMLINNPKIDLLSFFILRTLSDDVAATTAELSLIPFPSNLLLRDYLDSFDIVIFHNFKFSPFIDKKYLKNIQNYVRNGGAFVMIGGELSFQGGDYGKTPVEDILPVSLQKSSKKYSHLEFKPEIERELINHPILRLQRGGGDLKIVWESLPNLNGFNSRLEPSTDSRVLITHKRDRVHPILTVRNIGKGRTMAFATDSSWQWNFLRVGEGGSGRHYEQFWNNAIAWLTGRPDTLTLQLESDRERYRENEKALIKVRAFGEDYNPSANEKIKLTFSSVTKNQTLVTRSLEMDSEGAAMLELEPPGAGFYSVHAARLTGVQKDEREIRFGVFSQTVEFEKPLINGKLLKTAAEITGGTYQVLSEKTDLRELPLSNPETLVRAKSKTVTLFDGWVSYGLITGFLVFEWWLRRKFGLS